MNWEKLRPTHLFCKVEDICVEWLQKENKKYILLDVDNTIAVWDNDQISSSVDFWLKKVLMAEIKIVLVSNSGATRLRKIAGIYKVDYISWACKPFNAAFVKGMHKIGCVDKRQAIVIGDQLFTDVLGGNRLGLDTVLLTPRYCRDYIWTKFIRRIEKIALTKLGISKKTGE